MSVFPYFFGASANNLFFFFLGGGGETGGWIVSPPNFDILWMVHKVLSCSKTRETTRVQFGNRYCVYFYLQRIKIILNIRKTPQYYEQDCSEFMSFVFGALDLN